MDKNIDDTPALLDRCKIKATFFTLGWIAEQNLEVIKRIISEDHEIA
jgi:peptidoglycan/xylan/chitin deacetylase (PgdA/CDA1 family)